MTETFCERYGFHITDENGTCAGCGVNFMNDEKKETAVAKIDKAKALTFHDKCAKCSWARANQEARDAIRAILVALPEGK